MSSSPRPIRSHQSRSSSRGRSPFSTTLLSSSPLAQESIARDLAECSDDDDNDNEREAGEETNSVGSSSGGSTVRDMGDMAHQDHSMANSYRRPSFVTYGACRPTVTPQFREVHYLTKSERKKIREEECSLLRDNYLAPPKHAHPERNPSVFTKAWKLMFSPRRPKAEHQDEEEEAGGAPPTVPATSVQPTEDSPLLTNSNSGAAAGAGEGEGGLEDNRSRRERLDRQWEEAVAAGKIRTTWQREAKVMVQYASPLVVTFVLQYSLTVASIFTVGHLGKVELGAVSLASMTANITGYAVYQGLATSLDTLCAQAYGSGKKRLVGLQMQRMVWFLWALTLPMGVVWLSAESILAAIVPEKESARLAGLYLRVLLIGAPGYAVFESGKRFVQAQGLFSATTYVLLIAAPLNALMNWLFVWKFGWGFIGAPIAVVITDNLLPLLLFLYVYFIDGRQCWDGFTWRAFHNWGPMIKLALPGLLMIEAEYLAFELLTLAASYFSTTHLAAQSVLSTLTALTFQIPFSLSIAASTRVANLIGATLSDAAKTAAIVTIAISTFVGLFNVTLLSSLRNLIPRLFTDDASVVALVAAVLPLCAAFQLFDALAANCNGLLRGLGRQEIGGYVNLFCYYVIAMPISFGTAFGLGWGLEGLWCGVALALGLVAALEGWFLYRASWERAVEEAQYRNQNS